MSMPRSTICRTRIGDRRNFGTRRTKLVGEQRNAWLMPGLSRKILSRRHTQINADTIIYVLRAFLGRFGRKQICARLCPSAVNNLFLRFISVLIRGSNENPVDFKRKTSNFTNCLVFRGLLKRCLVNKKSKEVDQ